MLQELIEQVVCQRLLIWGVVLFFILRHLGEREESYRTWEWNLALWCFIKGWIFCSRLPLLVGNINSESPLKMLKKCTKSCLKLGFFHFYCMVLIQLLKKVLVDKGWRESSYNKKQFFRHCGEIPVKYLLSFFLLPPARAAAAVPMNCSGSKWFWRLAVLTSSAPSPVLLFLASFTGTEGWWVMHLVTGLLCFLHPFAKTRWVLISLNLRKLFQYGKETAQHSAAFLAPRTAPSTQELSQNVLLVCPCCSFVTTMCLSIWYWKTASVTCLSFGQSVRVVAAQDHGSSDNPAGCIPGAVCLVLLESIMESCLLKRQENYKGNVSKPLQAHHWILTLQNSWFSVSHVNKDSIFHLLNVS